MSQTKTSTRALLVDGGVLREVDIPGGDTYAALQRYVVEPSDGSPFCRCFSVWLGRGQRTLDGWCDDEFLLKDRPERWNVVLEGGTLYATPYAIGGPILILAGNARTGESDGLTEAEANRFGIDASRGALMPDGVGVRLIPTLTLRRQP